MPSPVRCYTTNSVVGECKPLYDALKKKNVPNDKIIKILHSLGFNKYPQIIRIMTHMDFHDPVSRK